MLRLLSSKAQGRNDFEKKSNPCHVGIHWIFLTEFSQMSTYVPGFQSFSGLLHDLVLAILATSSISVDTLLYLHLSSVFGNWAFSKCYYICSTSLSMSLYVIGDN